MSKTNAKRICVVGAGASGLTAIKACLEEGFQVVCYEMTDNISGIWHYRNKLVEGVGRVNAWTITNTSKEFNSFSDFPFPKEFPNYLDHKKMCEYFELYAKHFRLKPHIRFDHSVLNVCKSDDYDNTHTLVVRILNIKENMELTEIFDGVMVCVGINAIPRTVQLQGQDLFKGKIIHSRELGTRLELCQYEDMTAVVVGNGSSGCDSAIALSDFCERVYLSYRRGGSIMPRMIANGYPIDYERLTKFTKLLISVINPVFYQMIFERDFYRSLHSFESRVGVKNNNFIFNDELPTKILYGKVVMKDVIETFTENGVIFIGDKNETKCDLVVMATGYEKRFPFIDIDLIGRSDDNYLDLYKRVFPQHLSYPSLALIGNISTTGSNITAFEMQSRWYVQVMAGKCQFPSQSHMRSVMLADREKRMGNIDYRDDWSAYMDDIAHIIGVKPDLKQYFITDLPLFLRLLFGSSLPYQYRLKGVHSWSGARVALMQSDYRVEYGLNRQTLPKKHRYESFALNIMFLLIIVFLSFAYIVFNLF